MATRPLRCEHSQDPFDRVNQRDVVSVVAALEQVPEMFPTIDEPPHVGTQKSPAGLEYLESLGEVLDLVAICKGRIEQVRHLRSASRERICGKDSNSVECDLGLSSRHKSTSSRSTQPPQAILVSRHSPDSRFPKPDYEFDQPFGG